MNRRLRINFFLLVIDDDQVRDVLEGEVVGGGDDAGVASVDVSQWMYLAASVDVRRDSDEDDLRLCGLGVHHVLRDLDDGQVGRAGRQRGPHLEDHEEFVTCGKMRGEIFGSDAIKIPIIIK